MADHQMEPTVVIGLGRFGGAVARQLAAQGTEVLAIDSSEKAVASVSGQIANAAIADSTDVEAMRQLGVPDFRHAVVAIGSGMVVEGEKKVNPENEQKEIAEMKKEYSAMGVKNIGNAVWFRAEHAGVDMDHADFNEMVVKQYADTTAARLASQRLAKMESEGR